MSSSASILENNFNDTSNDADDVSTIYVSDNRHSNHSNDENSAALLLQTKEKNLYFRSFGQTSYTKRLVTQEMVCEKCEMTKRRYWACPNKCVLLTLEKNSVGPLNPQLASNVQTVENSLETTIKLNELTRVASQSTTAFQKLVLLPHLFCIYTAKFTANVPEIRKLKHKIFYTLSLTLHEVYYTKESRFSMKIYNF
ncbi:hypothetical protein BpHYR1_016545 [Brachionus plicatilis]|uniref:Uncharacterized protein n=1 Tax=Brachionus plicatilis TaxID=10195 RepID=A0A3M7T358_BRAPC|nr:hypothetical protein BpHYR1_016545 [Brachionus plicatilis]